MKKLFTVFGIIAFFGIVLAGGCIGGGLPGETMDIMEASKLEVTATILSVELSELGEAGCEICPQDKAKVRIDSIDPISENPMVKQVGDEMEIRFIFSARPAKIKYGLQAHCPQGTVFRGGSCVNENCEGPECAVAVASCQEVPNEMKDGYIIYHDCPTNGKTEKVFPGVKKGDKIRFTAWSADLGRKGDTQYVNVAEYGIIQ